MEFTPCWFSLVNIYRDKPSPLWTTAVIVYRKSRMRPTRVVQGEKHATMVLEDFIIISLSLFAGVIFKNTHLTGAKTCFRPLTTHFPGGLGSEVEVTWMHADLCPQIRARLDWSCPLADPHQR